jgi:hypothetical protein
VKPRNPRPPLLYRAGGPGLIAALLVVVFAAAPVYSQDDFGFGAEEGSGFGAEDAPAGKSGSAVKINGEVSAELQFFTGDAGSSSKLGNAELGDVFSGKLNFSASGSAADAAINLKLRPAIDGNPPRSFWNSSPAAFDEAYVRAYFGPVDVEGGLRKLTWGRADSFGPLDVVNPIDYSDLSSMADPRSVKIARPMLHLTWRMGSFSRLEGVFVPWFQGNEYALKGRWTPSQISGVTAAVAGLAPLFPWLQGFKLEDYYATTRYTLSYAQGGLRYFATAGSSDFGVQYYFGRLPRPAATVRLDRLAAVPPNLGDIINIDYNWYHHVGADFARVIGGFNFRFELGANITGDPEGTNGEVYNPSLVWSLGFDRDLVWGINLNLQGNGSIMLMHDRIGGNPLTDTEAGRDVSSTRITAILSKKFLQDELELKATALWGIEDKDFLIMPAVTWTRNSVSAELSAGFFGGSRDGELGQYRDNHYIKTMLTYSF